MTQPHPSNRNGRAEVVESEISEVLLRTGIPIVCAVLCIGLLIEFGSGVRELPWLPAVDPLLVDRLGLLALVSLPIFRVGAAFVGFTEEQDAILMAITGATLTLLIWSFHLASGL